jgi:hypothetical protein
VFVEVIDEVVSHDAQHQQKPERFGVFYRDRHGPDWQLVHDEWTTEGTRSRT